VVYHAYGAFEGSVGTKKSYFFPAKNPVDARWEVGGEGRQALSYRLVSAK
jgi:hypothetical protein